LACLCVVRLAGSVDKGQDPRTLRKRISWPQSFASFLPHGATGTVQGVCQWLSINPDPFTRSGIFNRLYLIVYVAQTVVNPFVIVSQAFLDGVFALITTHARLWSEMHNLDPRDKVTLIGDLLTESAHVILVVQRLAFKTLNRSEQKAFYERCTGRLPALYAAVEKAAAAASAVITRHRREDLDQCGRYTTDMMANRVVAVRKSTNDLRREFGVDFLQRYALQCCTFPIEMAMEAMRRMKHNQRCFAPACLKTIADGRLKQCMGCSYAEYCSRRCQKRGWIDKDVGHRLWCTAAKEVVSPEVADEHQKAMGKLLLDYVDRLGSLKMNLVVRLEL
jgi:hypothetical protein